MKKTDIFALPAILCWAGAALPYSAVKSIADGIASDGNMERMTESFHSGIRIGLVILAVFLTAFWLWIRMKPGSVKRFFASLGSLPGRFCRDCRPFFTDLGLTLRNTAKNERILLFLILLGGIIVRLLLLERPLDHDEAYSIYEWGRRDMRWAMTDYHLPNNHLFHTFLVNLIYHTLGKEIWMLRLPVFLSGIMTIPGVWLLGKSLYDRKTGIAAAGLTAFAPYLIFYSVNARGYGILTCLTVYSLLDAVYLRRKKNLFGWGLLVILSALNFFTLPIALYPFGGICVWFLFAFLISDVPESYSGKWNFFKYLIGCGIFTVILTMLLYTPLFKVSGLASFFGNQYVGPVPEGEFWITFGMRMTDTYHAFCDTLPAPVWILLALGNLLALLFHQRISRMTIPYQVPLVLWMAAVMSFQKPNLWPRTLLFFHPLLILWGTAGISALLEKLLSRKAAAVILAILAVLAAVPQFRYGIENYGVMGVDEKAVYLFLETEGENAPNALFVTAPSDNAPIWVYADRKGLPIGIFDKLRRFNVVYAFYNPRNDAYNAPKDLEDLLVRFGPGKNFIDFGTEKVLMETPNGLLYRYEIRPSAVEKAYGDQDLQVPVP